MAVKRSFRARLLAAVFLLQLGINLHFATPSWPWSRAGFGGHERAGGASSGRSHIDRISLSSPYDPVPSFKFAALAQYPPQNVDEPSRFAFSTLYCSRVPNVRDPYFEATQAIIYRILWSEHPSKYPFIVFVCPFIPNELRQILRGQGAIVKGNELLDNIIPDHLISAKRWIDVLSKLHLWREVEWRRLVFLDSDAFPMTGNNSIDDIFEVGEEQHCKENLLAPEDRAIVAAGGERAKEFCNYVYSGVAQFEYDNINAGVLIFKPNLDMHAKLLRAAHSTDDYELSSMEQGVLRSVNAFHLDGAFPVQHISHVWNTLPEVLQERRMIPFEFSQGLQLVDEGPVRILHAKMWNVFWASFLNMTELTPLWDHEWMLMCRFYDDDESGFVKARKTGVLKTSLQKLMETIRFNAEQDEAKLAALGVF